MRHSSLPRGFTLIELSLVIVLIGLIVAGIMAGESLLERSKIMSVVQEVDDYKSAVQQFVDKYQELPGDMVDAYTYFDTGNTDHRCGLNDAIAISVDNCNGDGNGVIGNDPNGYMETLRGWQHLQLAGLVSGTFDGYWAVHYSPGETIPRSRLDNGAGYNLSTIVNLYGINGHFLTLARGSGGDLTGTALTVADAIAIDQKLDDGIAATGWVLAQDGASYGPTTNCVASNVYVKDVNINNGAPGTNDQCILNFLVQKTY